MADIELVIKVPECFYEYCKAQTDPIEIELAVAKGIPLPKGHGRVIDESKITKYEQIGLIVKDGNVTRCLKTDAPTIVEADK